MVFQFNQLTLDTVQYRLYLSGKAISVEPQVFDLLVYLVENRERVVSRDELLENLWQGKVVTDAALGVCLKDARKAVCDSGDRQSVIKTVHGRGYQFIAKVSESREQSVATTSSAISDHESLVLPDEPSIAVLAFTNMASDPEQEFFSDGITEDIITALSKISALMVIARNSTFIYKGRTVDVKQVGRDQGVRYVLEGSVRKSGKRVRVTAQLIDATTGQHKWAERYDRDLKEFFLVQDEITQEIVSALDVHLLKGEQARFWSSSTENLAAWESFRMGHDLMDTYRAENLPEAMRLVQKAIDFDPQYAAAWSLMALCYFCIEEDSRRSNEERKQALRSTLNCAERALECDPSCASAYSLLGLYHLILKQYDDAIDNANKSINMAPNHAYNIARSAFILSKCGQPEQAYDRMQKSLRLCPVYPVWFLSGMGQVSRAMDRIDETIDAYTEWISRDPDTLEGHICLAEILGEVGRTEEATASAAEVLRINPDFSIGEYVGNLAYRNPKEISRFEDGLRNAGLPE